MSSSLRRFSVACWSAVVLGLLAPRGARACAYPGCVLGRFIPAAAHARGVDGALWVTDLRLLNTGSEAISVHVEFLRSDSDNAAESGVDVEVPPLQSVFLPDVVAKTLGSEGGGGLRLSTPAGSGHFLAEARTYDASRPELGTHGFATADVGAESAAPDSFLIVSNAPGPDGARTNIGFLNPLLAPARVDFRLLDAAGRELGSSTVFLRSLGHAQVDDVFAALGAGTAAVDSGVVRIRARTWVVDPPSSPVPIFGYATVIDRRSNDPSFSLAGGDRADTPPPP